MTRDETAKLLKLIKLNFPNAFKHLKDRSEYDLILDLWTANFSKFSATDCAMAFNEYLNRGIDIATPSIGQLQGDLLEVLNSKVKLPQIGFDEVWIKCIDSARCNPRQAKEQFLQLPENVQKALGGFGTLVDIGYSDQTQCGFIKRKIEKEYESILKEEKTMFDLGQIGIEEVKKRNELPFYRKDEIAENVRQAIEFKNEF